MQTHHTSFQSVSGGLKVIWLTLSVFLSGCSGIISEGGTNGKRMMPATDCVLTFSSQGGFGDVFVQIDVKRERTNAVSLIARIGKNPLVRKEYPQNAPVVTKVDAILASGVFDLPAQYRKAERAGRDLPQIKMVYRTTHSEKTITRDYRWAEKFETSFHEAEKLFAEIVNMAGRAKP